MSLFDVLDGNPQPGGTWTPLLASGTDIFNPAIDPQGIYVYEILSSDCGNSSSTLDITLVNQPNAGTNLQLTICADEAPIDLLLYMGGSPDHGGVWFPTLSGNSNLFDPSKDKTGIYTYTVSNGTCESFSEIDITVLKEINAGDDGELSICVESAPVNLFDFLKGHPNAGGIWHPSLPDGNGIFNQLRISVASTPIQFQQTVIRIHQV